MPSMQTSSASITRGRRWVCDISPGTCHVLVKFVVISIQTLDYLLVHFLAKSADRVVASGVVHLKKVGIRRV
jgi:hypothetical protein